MVSKYKFTGIIYIQIGVNERVTFLYIIISTQNSVFIAPDEHMNTLVSYTICAYNQQTG